MSNVVGTLGGLSLQPFNIPFEEKPLENAVDVMSLDSTLSTDFVNRRREWDIAWKVLTEDQYNDLKAVYDAQFSSGIYPTFIITYYSINTPVRMYINEKDIRKDGCEIWNVKIKLVQKTGY